jgi:hypothetical protein
MKLVKANNVATAVANMPNVPTSVTLAAIPQGVAATGKSQLLGFNARVLEDAANSHYDGIAAICAEIGGWNEKGKPSDGCKDIIGWAAIGAYSKRAPEGVSNPFDWALKQAQSSPAAEGYRAELLHVGREIKRAAIRLGLIKEVETAKSALDKDLAKKLAALRDYLIEHPSELSVALKALGLVVEEKQTKAA